MSTNASLFIGVTPEWLGTLQRHSCPTRIARVEPGRRALTATDPDEFRVAVTELLDLWGNEPHGGAVRPYRNHGWTPYEVDYLYAFGWITSKVWIQLPNHTMIPATEHLDLQAD